MILPVSPVSEFLPFQSFSRFRVSPVSDCFAPVSYHPFTPIRLLQLLGLIRALVSFSRFAVCLKLRCSFFL
ncbi:hypothetical protein EBR25_01530 [bacterium]|nr:hypothetical protein [bacterium]